MSHVDGDSKNVSPGSNVMYGDVYDPQNYSYTSQHQPPHSFQWSPPSGTPLLIPDGLAMHHDRTRDLPVAPGQVWLDSDVLERDKYVRALSIAVTTLQHKLR